MGKSGKNLFLLVILFLTMQLHTDSTASKDALPKKSICLNMIVKNESKEIKNCLASLLKVIDYWVIVDTGSVDGTQKIIREFLKDIPGELHERPWVNFAHNRNEALQFAKNKADYVLLIDADERLAFAPNFAMPKLEMDCYSIVVRMSEDRTFDFQRVLLINNHLNWKWEGVIHEYLVCPQAKSLARLNDVVNLSLSSDGARSQDPQKFQKDIQVLERAIETDPTNARNVFYLAQSYDKVGNRALALKHFEKRASMGGCDQEVFWSLYAIGRLHTFQNAAAETILNSFCRAYAFRPSRAEPLYRLAEYFFETQNYILGYALAKLALSIPMSQDLGYVEKWIYEYGVLFQLANCAAGLGKNEEARAAYHQLLLRNDLPTDIRKLVKNNMEVCFRKISAQP